MERVTPLSLDQQIFHMIYCRGKELLLGITEVEEFNVKLHSALIDIANITDNSQDILNENENKILDLLGIIFNECTVVTQNDVNYQIQNDSYNFCCYCLDKISSSQGFPDYTNAKEVTFAIAGFLNIHIQSKDLCQKYIKLVQNHTALMTDAVLYYMQVRYKGLNNLLHSDEELICIIFNNVYHDLLPWFRKRTLWSKFHFLFYRKCLELDTSKKYFYDPQHYMEFILKALYRKEHGHNVRNFLNTVLSSLEYDRFIRNYFYKFTSNYNVCSDDEVYSSYNYNLLHYVLPAIIDAYPSKVLEIIETLSSGRPFFEDLFLISLTIASRRKLISTDWCLNDHIYYTLQVCQGWIAERTLIVIITEIGDSNNIVSCFTLFRQFMTGATYERLCAVQFLHLLEKFNIHLKSFVSKITQRKNSDDHMKHVSSFLTFILEFSKARFKDSEASQKQYYFEILQRTRQNLPEFFCNIPTKIYKEQLPSGTCATHSVKHFLHTLNHYDDTNLSIEEIDYYLRVLLQHKQIHSLEHGLVIQLRKFSHSGIHSLSSNVLAATLSVYRKIMQAKMLSDNCIKVDNIERIILTIIPKQSDSDPNIFVDMDAGFERAVIEGMKIISHLVSDSVEYNLVDFLRLCEHIMEYGPSKKLVLEISRLHRSALREQSIKNTQCFVNYITENISLITGRHVLSARRAMRRHPSVTETMRNILITVVEHEARSNQILNTTLQNELMNYVKSTKSTDDKHFVLVTETQKVVFDTKEFCFGNIIRVEELIMLVLRKLDIATKWEVITALVQLLQAILSTFLQHSDPILFRRYFNLAVEVTSFVPTRTITAMAGLYVLHILRFRDIPSTLGNRLPKFHVDLQNITMLSKALYECTICADIVPYNAVVQLTNDINSETPLERYSNETCRAITTLVEHLYKDSFGN